MLPRALAKQYFRVIKQAMKLLVGIVRLLWDEFIDKLEVVADDVQSIDYQLTDHQLGEWNVLACILFLAPPVTKNKLFYLLFLCEGCLLSM